MPPKAQKEKIKKIVEDKTFGMKNKNKSKKVQQFIHSVEAQAAMAGKSRKDAAMEEQRRKAREEAKKAADMQKKEEATLFKAVVKETRVPIGVDPKSVLCEFFKAGKCTKGAKCRFSHDGQVNMKSARIDVYSDPRELKNDTMDKWDQEKLEAVVSKKGAGRMPPTDIVCKYFLDAIENSQYGWFWECPNGEKCHYRHALPPGFTLKSKVKEEKVDTEDEPTIEEQIEIERKKLDLTKCTPVTPETFAKWKAEKMRKREEEVEKKRKEQEKKGGHSGLNGMSGRDLFRYDPTLFVDDDEADDEEYKIEDQDGQDDDDDGESSGPLYDVDAQHDDVDGEDGDEADDASSSISTSTSTSTGTARPINENLFLDDDDDVDDDDEEHK